MKIGRRRWIVVAQQLVDRFLWEVCVWSPTVDNKPNVQSWSFRFVETAANQRYHKAIIFNPDHAGSWEWWRNKLPWTQILYFIVASNLTNVKIGNASESNNYRLEFDFINVQKHDIIILGWNRELFPTACWRWSTLNIEQFQWTNVESKFNLVELIAHRW